MEHIIQEQMLDDLGEKILHCSVCDDWVSLEDHIETIKEFQDSPCPGTRQQQQDEEDVYNEAMESHAKAFPIVFHIMDNEEKAALEEALSRHADDYECYCDHKWDDDIMRKHEKHSCYLDKSHPGGHICGFCIEGYDALESEADEYEPKDDGGPVFPSPFYHGPDFDKKED